jgi:hypothetical protein
MTAEEIEDAELIGRIEDLADRLEAGTATALDSKRAADLLRLMAECRALAPPPQDRDDDPVAVNDNVARGRLH